MYKRTSSKLTCFTKNILFFSFLLCSLSIYAGQEKIINDHPGTGPIAIIGDSLARGRGAENLENTPANCFRKNFPGNVNELAVDGRTSLQLLEDLDAPVNLKPKLIFVSSGGNDAINDVYFKDYPEQKTLTEIPQIFDKLLATGALVVYLGLNPPFPEAARLPKVSDIARTKGVLVVDGMNGLWQSDKMWDDFHPNDLGYQEMCKKIFEAVKGHYP